MKITSIDLISSDNTTAATFSFRDPRATNPYLIRDIIGLDAEEIIPRFYGPSRTSSSRHYSLSLAQRDIVFSIVLNPRIDLGESYSDLRDKLYKSIASSRTGLAKLFFKNDATVIAQIYGFVTKFESIITSKSQEIKITISCDDPILRSVDPIYVDVVSFGIFPTIVDSLSTAPHGFAFSIEFIANTSSFLIHDHVETNWSFNVVYPFLNGDILYFSSEYENKYLTIVRDALTIPLVDKIVADSVWPTLFPGNNAFHIATGSFTWRNLYHYLSYWGV